MQGYHRIKLTFIPVIVSVRLSSIGLLVGAFSILGNTSVANAQPNRYDHVLFICQSVDPTDSLLNLRGRPGGVIKDTISRKERFYVWGFNLNRPRTATFQ
jgi:hypothetical protein